MTSTVDNSYNFICKLSNIPRFQGCHLLAPYSVAEHTLRVIYLVSRMLDETDYTQEEKSRLTRVAMMHDFEESMTGDIPSLYKDQLDISSYRVLKMIQKETGIPNDYIVNHLCKNENIIEIADKLECFITTSYELERGNISMKRSFNNLKEYLKTLIIDKDGPFLYIRTLYYKAIKDVEGINELV